MERFTIRQPDGREEVRPLDDEGLTFGRSRQNDLVLTGTGISRRHGRLYRDAVGQWWVEDLGSMNGLLINNRFTRAEKVDPGDVITIGAFELILGEADSCVDEGAGGLEVTIAGGDVSTDMAMERPARQLVVTDAARLMALYELTKRLFGQHDVTSLIDEAADALSETIGAGYLVFGLTCDPERESDRLVVRPRSLAKSDVRVSRSVLQRAMEAEQAVLVRDTSSDQNLREQVSIVAGEINSALCVPMHCDRGVSGFIYMDNRQRGRSYDERDLEFASAIGAIVGTAVENARLQEEALLTERLQAELAGARQVQQAILPSQWPEVPGWDIYGEHHSCHEVAGDFYDALVTQDGAVWLMIADVSGKGAPAALFASRVHAAAQALIERCDSPGQLLTQLNELIVRREMGPMFVTCLLMRLEPQTNEVMLANAGHASPIFFGPEGHGRLIEAEAGVVLGFTGGQRYPDTAWTVPTGGGTLLSYTDGVSEAFDANDEQFGDERVAEIVADIAGPCSARELVETLRQSVEAFVRQGGQHDDMTILSCRSISD